MTALSEYLATARVLTIKPPWSWATMFGGKNIENRSTNWHHRGPLLIHAGAGWSRRGADSPLVRAAWWGDDPAAPDSWGHAPLPRPLRIGGHLYPGAMEERDPDPSRIVWHGEVIGAVDLVDVHVAGPCTEPGGPCHPWGENSYTEAGGTTRTDVTHLVLENPRPIPRPIPQTGALGLWTPDPDLITEVADQLEELLTP